MSTLCGPTSTTPPPGRSRTPPAPSPPSASIKRIEAARAKTRARGVERDPWRAAGLEGGRDDSARGRGRARCRRHDRDRALREGKRGPHVQEDVRVPPRSASGATTPTSCWPRSIVDGSSGSPTPSPWPMRRARPQRHSLPVRKSGSLRRASPHPPRVITDNGSCYRSGDFAESWPTDPAQVHPALHPPPQREDRALPADPGRRTPLHARIPQRGRTLSRTRGLEHPLQLPSTPQRRGRPTASISTQDRRHQRPALLHLGTGPWLNALTSEFVHAR